jgi:hypothetical protein
MQRLRWLFVAIVALAVIAVGVSVWWARDPGFLHFRYASEISEGNRLVTRIDDFRKTTGRLPDSLSDLGIRETESSLLHYRRVSSNQYVIWFGTSLGESMQFDSQTRRWE